MNFVSGCFSNHLIFSYSDLANTALLYCIPFISTALLFPIVKNARKLTVITQQLNHFKGKDEVFGAQLKMSTYYEVDNNDSRILLGNANANIRITIFTNPHCEPCGRMHKRVRSLLEKAKENICIQYIFSSFNEDLNVSSLFLVSTYLNNRENAGFIFNEWYEKGRYNREQFYKKYPISINDKKVKEEFKNHVKWMECNKLFVTPTILVNGYLLPREYSIEDLELITRLEI